jgi:hypothetical protein
MMSCLRHNVIWKDAEEGKWWLDIVRWDVNNEIDCLSNNADTIGSFKTQEDAEEYLDNYQNTGYGTPVLDPEVFEFLSHPKKWINKKDPWGEDFQYRKVR